MNDIVNAVLIKSSIQSLEKTIKEFNKEASRQTQQMIRLTIGILILTSLLLIGLIVQVMLFLK